MNNQKDDKKIEKLAAEFIEDNLKDLAFRKVESYNITLDINKT